MLGQGRAGDASGSKELLDHVAWEAVEEKAQHEQPQQRQHDLDDQPLVPGADEVLYRLERVQEPDEGCVRPARAGRRWEEPVRQSARATHAGLLASLFFYRQ